MNISVHISNPILANKLVIIKLIRNLGQRKEKPNLNFTELFYLDTKSFSIIAYILW